MGLWQSATLALLGGLIGVFSTLAAWSIQAREARQIRSEQAAREDTYRLFHDRVRAYTDFHKAFSSARPLIRAASQIPSEQSRGAAMSARNDVFEAFIILILIGHIDVLDVGWNISRYVRTVAEGSRHFDDHEWNELVTAFRRAVRNTLLGEPDLSSDRRRERLRIQSLMDEEGQAAQLADG